jgi:hypothetical protein
MRVYPNTGTSDNPTYPLEANPENLLDKSDLVYIDSKPGSGYTQTISPAINRDIDDDEQLSQLIHDYIIQYLTINGKQGAPIYLYAGSQGGRRAAYIVNKLYDSGIVPKGAILYSPMTRDRKDECIQNVNETKPSHSCADSIPTLAATSHYYGIAGQGLSLDDFMSQVYQFVEERYRPEELKALKNGTVPPDTVLSELQEKIGIDLALMGKFPYTLAFDFPKYEYIEAAALNCPTGEGNEDCPSDMNDMRKEKDAPAEFLPPNNTPDIGLDIIAEDFFDKHLGYTSLVRYSCQNGPENCAKKPPLIYSTDNENELESIIPSWARALKNNPDLRILSMGGYYDFAVNFYATLKDFSDPSLDVSRIQTVVLNGGHNITHQSTASRAQMRELLVKFYESESATIEVKNDRVVAAWNYPLSKAAFLTRVGATSSAGQVIINMSDTDYSTLFSVPGTYEVPLKAGHARTQVVLEVLKESIPPV